MPGLIVKKSKIQGLGVFAGRDFKQGETVLRWGNSKQLSEEEAERVPAEEKKYVAFFGGKYIFQLPPARYVNHSCSPNTFVRDFCDVALKGIKKGEEITSDYSKCPEPGMEMKCNCKSKKCRHTIRSGTKIKCIIFDFGGVLTTTKCFPILAERLSKRLFIKKELIQEHLYANETPYLLGEESTQDFWEKNLKQLGIPFQALVEEFASWYVLNQETLKLANSLKKNFRIILFSDNFDALSPTIRKDQALTGLFEEMFFSNEMHKTKAQAASFKRILKKLGLKPEECVFIDDHQKSLEQPNKLGIHTILFKNAKQAKKELNALGAKA